jgi:diguanylate cyclase (GGDEF)-like protein
MGDNVLVFLANTVKKHIRETDVFCRWGGEEFLILTPNSNGNAIKMTENLRKVIDECSKEMSSIPHFTCSFGVAEVRPDRSYMPTIEEADKLLYKSKTTGKNKVSH